MKTLLKNIRPAYATEFANPCDVLRFEIDGRGEWLEYIDADGTLCGSEESNLHGSLPTEAANEIREQLATWLDNVRSSSFADDINSADVESIWYGLNRSQGVQVILTSAGAARLGVLADDDGVMVEPGNGGGYTVAWHDVSGGYQEVQCAPGGDEDKRVLVWALENPASAAIDAIEGRLAYARDVLDDLDAAA